MTVPLQGSCFCGTVAFSATSLPILKAYCHCSNCQRLTGCPFVHTVHFPGSAFTWTRPDDVDVAAALDAYTIPNRNWKTRYRCKSCGVCVASYNSRKETWSLWGALLVREKEGRIEREVWEIVKPDTHIFYGTRMLDVNDELGKWEGYPDTSRRLA